MMSMSSLTLSLIALSENDKLRGYESYTAWKTLMEVHGRPKGLHKYWENLVIIPTSTTATTSDVQSPSQSRQSPGCRAVEAEPSRALLDALYGSGLGLHSMKP